MFQFMSSKKEVIFFWQHRLHKHQYPICDCTEFALPNHFEYRRQFFSEVLEIEEINTAPCHRTFQAGNLNSYPHLNFTIEIISALKIHP
jgi:hypothetical protein